MRKIKYQLNFLLILKAKNWTENSGTRLLAETILNLYGVNDENT